MNSFNNNPHSLSNSFHLHKHFAFPLFIQNHNNFNITFIQLPATYPGYIFPHCRVFRNVCRLWKIFA